MAEPKSYAFFYLVAGGANIVTLPYVFKADPAEHLDANLEGGSGGVLVRYQDAASHERIVQVDFVLDFTVAVVGNPPDVEIYWGQSTSETQRTLIYKRVNGVAVVNLAPQATYRSIVPATVELGNLFNRLFWSAQGGPAPDAANHVEITITGTIANAQIEFRQQGWTYSQQYSHSAHWQPAGSGRADFLIWRIPALPPDWEVDGAVRVSLIWNYFFRAAPGNTLNILAPHLLTGPYILKSVGQVVSFRVQPFAEGSTPTWPSSYVIEVEWANTSLTSYELGITATLTLNATLRFKGSGASGGGSGSGGGGQSASLVVGGEGASGAERLLGLVTVDAIGFDGPAVDSGASVPTQAAVLHFVNGFEEGSFRTNAAGGDGVWTEVLNNVGGLSIVAGFHGASQYAARFTCDGTKAGGSYQVNLPVSGAASIRARLYVNPITTPTVGSGMTMFLISVDVGVAPFFMASVSWMATGKLRVENRAGGSVDSTGDLQSGDRLEIRVVPGAGGLIEVKMYTGDNTLARETVTLNGNPAPGDPPLKRASFEGTTHAAGQSGVIELDDVGVSYIQADIGPGTVLLAKPVQDLDPQWARVGGGAANHEAVDDYPGAIDDTTYLATSSPSKVERFGIAIPRAEFAKVGSVVKTLVGVMRAERVGTDTIRQMAWDEAGRVVSGPFWQPTSGGATPTPTVPATPSLLTLDVDDRPLATLALWNTGVESPGTLTAEIRAMVVAFNLDVLERD